MNPGTRRFCEAWQLYSANAILAGLAEWNFVGEKEGP